MTNWIFFSFGRVIAFAAAQETARSTSLLLEQQRRFGAITPSNRRPSMVIGRRAFIHRNFHCKEPSGNTKPAPLGWNVIVLPSAPSPMAIESLP